VRQRRPRHAQRGEQVSVQHRLQVGVVGGGEVARPRTAHVVDDHIDAAVRADRGIDDGRHTVGRRHVGGDAQGRAVGTAARPRFAHRRIEVGGVARAQDDARPLAGEGERDGAANPAAGAGDERDFAGQPEVHGGDL
jgi:hypothetical protein